MDVLLDDIQIKYEANETILLNFIKSTTKMNG